VIFFAVAVELVTLGLGMMVAWADCECDPRPLDVVFIIDSTGSMSSAIESVKHRVERCLDLLRENAPAVRVGIVTYRDVGDEYLRRGLELTEDFPKVIEYLRGITANGGGDTPEAIEAGLEMAYSQEEMRWEPRAKKVCVLVADAPCHDDKKAICLDFATHGREKGIGLFTISVDGNVPGFKELAAAGGGKNVDIQRTDDIARFVLALALDRDASEFESAFGESRAPKPERPHSSSFGAPSSEGGFVLNQLQHAGDWDPPHHSARLLRALRDRASVDARAERRVVKVGDEALEREPLLYVTGHGMLGFTQEEEETLKKYVDRGGTILIERCCDGEAFDKSARALARRLSGVELAVVGSDHAVYRAGGLIDALDHTREHGGHDYVARRPVLLVAADARGRPRVVYSPTDLGCGWSGFSSGKSCALREADALKWTINILLWILST
jgi:hypothetical protein